MAKQKISNYVFLPGVGSTTNLYPNAYSIIQANYDFIKAETIAYINASITTDNASNLYPNAVTLLTNNRTFIIDETQAWIAAQVAAAGVGTTWYGYTYTSSVFRQNLTSLVDAYTHDIRYGGNEQTIYVAKSFWLGGAQQLVSPTQDTLAFNQAITLINNNILPRTLYTSQQSPVTSTQNTAGSSAEIGVTTLVSAFGTIVSNTIAGGLSTLPIITYSARNFAGYLFDSSHYNLNIKYVLDAYVNDIRYGGNAQTRFIASRNWNGDTPQISGDRKAEITAETFLRNLIINTVLPKSASYVPYQITEPLVRTMSAVAETASYARVTTLSNILITVITNGLSSLPALSNGVSTIKVQGKYDLEQLLLITNSTGNTILYNFSDPLAGAKIDYFSTTNTRSGDPYSDEFPAFRNIADYVTTITLVADTSSASVSDDIQIFYEAKEQKTRPYDFGTDAIERMRVAQPQSMLDADFEYGLQPTKWQAIGLSRGYPSVYELPGTDTSVISVVTDASAGTAGVGESLITVTTQSAHGFLAGSPITIRALANTIVGFSRAEGTFIINSVPTPTTFTYFATAKVGATNGQVLATTYTQLRKGAFYTGAGVSIPTFSVFSNGVSGTFTTKFITAVNSDQIAVAGSVPPIGTPVTGSGILAGTQVSGTVGSSGLVVTAGVAGGSSSGATSIEVIDATGIVEGLGLDNGTGTAIFVSGITGTTVSLTGQLTAAKSGATQAYLNVGGTNIANTGSGATFNITRNAGVYSIDTFTGGSNYRVNQRALVLGTNLGGASPANDAYVTINSISTSPTNSVIGLNAGTLVAGSGYSNTTGIATTVSPSGGTGLTVNISVVNGIVSTLALTTPGSSYSTIDGAATTGGTGTGLTVNITQTSGIIDTVVVNQGGTGYTVNDVITIIGGLADATVTVSTVINGKITSITVNNPGIGYNVADEITIGSTGRVASVNTIVAGTGYSTATGLATTGGTGTGLTVNIVDDGAGGILSVTVNNPGSGYTVSNVITVVQSGGSSGTFNVASLYNDATITVSTVDTSVGAIATATIAGTAVSASNLSFTGVASTVVAAAGSGATFDITRSALVYGTALINLAGINYRVNERITILGTSLGGTVPTNNATITITGVGAGGGITAFSTAGTGAGGSSVDFYSAISISADSTVQIPDATSLSFAAIATVQVTFPYTHGLVPGASVMVDITSTGSNHALAKGPFYVDSVPNKSAIRYTARAVGTIDTGTSLIGNLFCRSDSYFIHRPFDGGVQLGTGGPVHGGQAIRMSKKYIRYQSGKGINFNTGALFAPSYNIQSITANGTAIGSFITVTTDDVDHGCQPGGQIQINGIETKGYNGKYIVADIIDERTLRIQATTVLSGNHAILTTNAQMSVLYWHGSTVRTGTFDDQNGLFFQYDGQQFAVGRRSATFQLAGTISVAKDSNYVTGTNSRFRDQIKAGDRIVIRGMTHVVTGVDSNTVMYVNPDYRGATNAVNAKACLVQEFIVPQSEFNLDKLDGTGPSGYNLDVTKMQMIGMQWSWYAVGFIDFMLRGSDGNFVFFHRIRNSNVNTEAYMRTGNMPVRYEVQNESGKSSLFSSITATQTTIPLVDARGFPNESGVVYIDNELISFSGKSGNTLTGCTRGSSLTNFTGGSQRTFTAGAAATHEYNTGVILVSCTISPIISHWGSAMLTDGQFDNDRGYLFNYASTGIQVSTTKQTAFMIRLAPSVSNAQIGDLGDRELLNRAQLLLKGIEVTSDTGTGGLVVEGVLNPSNYPIDPGSITWSGLSSQAAGGQPSFAQLAPGGSISWSGGATITTATATTATSLYGGSTVPGSALFASTSGSNLVYVTQASWEAMGGSPGIAVSTSNVVISTGTCTVGTISGSGTSIAPWVATITGTLNTLGLSAGMTISATVGTGTLHGGTPTSVRVTSFVASTSITYAAIGGTTPTAGNVTNVSVVGETRFSAGTTVSTAVINPNPVALTLNSASGTLFVPNNSAFGVGNNQNYLYVTQASATTVFGNTNPVGVKIISADYPAGTTITAIFGPNIFNGQSYFQINLSQNSTVSHPPNSTTTVAIGGTVNSGNSLLFSQSSWNALPIGANQVGNSINDSGRFAGGTTISTVSALQTFNGINYYTVTFSSSLLTPIIGNASITFGYTAYYTLTMSRNSISAVPASSTILFTPAILSPATSFLFFTKTSWEALVTAYSATAGTEVDDAAKFPSGTKISSITVLQTFAGIQYYRVNFTQSSITAIGTSIAVTFKFGQPAYAQPGETVFSFIASPGSNGSLDLSDLKELTNTTLGGRGTYPNGPDVLAINVYKTSGTAISTNVIIRWGEAQA